MVPASRILAEPRGDAGQAVAYLAGLADTGEYTRDDWVFIAGQYWDLARPSGVDPLLAMAQCLHETANLSSWWAERPRRNPAGIGVTGEAGKGVSFPSWHHSARAHVGRLAAYALPIGAGTAAQRQLITEAAAWRFIPTNRRGAAPTLAGLTGTWSVGDPRYAEKVAGKANRITGKRGEGAPDEPGEVEPEQEGSG